MEQKLYDAAAKLPETSLDFYTIQSTHKEKHISRTWRVISSLAACVILLISIGFVTVEAKEYNEAIAFFNEYSLSTDGLSRGEIKAVYRDITTKSFTYSKTAEVISNSLSSDQIGGYEILQDDPAPEDIEKVWNYMNHRGGLPTPNGVRYEKRYEHKDEITLSKSFFEKYDGDTLLWSTCIPELWINKYQVVSDGIIVYGNKDTTTWSDWMGKIDLEGNLLWLHILNNGFEQEEIVEILENPNGSYSVISHGDHKYLCLSQYTADGVKTDFKKTDVGRNTIMNAARLGDGYIVQLGQGGLYDKDSQIVKLDRECNISEAFSYDGGDAYYYITDMIEYNDSVYLSAYAVPKLADEDQNAGGRYEIAAVIYYLFDNNIGEISSEELTPIVRDNYTAMLLVCDPTAGSPEEFYSVKGSLGGELSLSKSGMLLWDVESITTTSYLPTTNFCTLRGTSYVFRYTFDSAGILVSQEKTGEVVDYTR